VESEEGKGARFTLTLPRGGEAGPSDRRDQKTERRTGQADRRQKPRA
jgi:hypothetical protein